MEGQSRYLLIKGKAGLGNRMLSAITGILYAKLSHRRIIIDWSDYTYSNDGTNVFSRLFSLSESENNLPNYEFKSVRPKVWTGNLHKSASELIEEVDPKAHSSLLGNRAFSVHPLKPDYDEQLLVMWSYHQQIGRLRRYFKGEFGWLAKMTDDEIISWLLSDVMQLNANIKSLVDTWWEQRDGQRPVIGVHVRFMDRRISLEHFYKAVDKLLLNRPDATIFLATDNPMAQKAVETRYPRVCSTEKWFPQTGITMHQNPECPDRLANAIEALRDMYILARCDYLVFPGSSTFSVISSLVSKAGKDNIIDVEGSNVMIQLNKFLKQKVL